MRYRLLTVLSACALTAGCPTETPPTSPTGDPQVQSESCALYLACLEAVGSPNLDLERAVYGPEGECWAEGAQEALACTIACDGGLLACENPTPTTDTSTGSTTTPCESVTLGPTLITSASVMCGAGDDVTISAATSGWVQVGGDNSFYATDSANVERWSESHPIDSNGNRDECGAADELELVLATNSYPPSSGTSAYEPGVSSFYSCDAHFTQPVMTYAIAIVDVDGNYADCLAFGDDPVGLVNGDYDEAFGAPPEMDLSQCATALGR